MKERTPPSGFSGLHPSAHLFANPCRFEVHLNLAGKNHALVGLGSYIVNAQIPCNDCHSPGPPTQFAPNSNPFMGQTPVVNPKTYLGGGRDFGAYGPIHIISRNLRAAIRSASS